MKKQIPILLVILLLAASIQTVLEGTIAAQKPVLTSSSAQDRESHLIYQLHSRNSSMECALLSRTEDHFEQVSILQAPAASRHYRVCFQIGLLFLLLLIDAQMAVYRLISMKWEPRLHSRTIRFIHNAYGL